MANVSPNDIRDAINVTEADIPDVKLQKMVKRAEVTLELELGKEIDANDCTNAEKEFITLLAAVYAVCYLTGGSAVGLRTSAGLAVAQKVYAAATAFATAVQNSLNISFGTFLALTGVGIGVIVAAAAAMLSFASSMNQATTSVQNFNGTTADMQTRARSITRSGEEELYRRGVE